MELSKCRICGERHRLGGCPESVARATALADAKHREKSYGWTDEAKAREEVAAVAASKMANDHESKLQAGVGSERSSPETNSGAPQPRGEPLQTNATQPSGSPNKRAPRGTFDRKAYQREYMRARRASGKVDKWDRRRQAEKRETGK